MTEQAPDGIEDAARAIVEHHLGWKDLTAKRLGGGLNNHVFEVASPTERIVVRIGDKGGKTEAFLKEQWCATRAAEAGVPAPSILQVGSDVIDLPYMLLEPAEGAPADKCTDRLPILRHLGEIARRLHSIETKGFGKTFDWSANQLSRCESWGEFLRNELDYPAKIALLTEAGAIDADMAKRLADAFERLSAEAAVPRLNHGDLRLKNLFVQENGELAALIDWEDATSNAARWWDLSIALHDLGVDEKEAFLTGYGLEPDEAQALRSAWAALNIVNYADAVEAAREQDDRARIAWMAARLRGALDLYAID